jgi:putative membrane protein insertion efficiency factor
VNRPAITRAQVLWVVRSPIRALFIGAIRAYQLVISPGLPGRCKFYPSCSQYALDAVRDYGAARGFVLAVWRILRCNPLSYGGYDPVSRQKLFARGSSHHESGSGGHLAGAYPATGVYPVPGVYPARVAAHLVHPPRAVGHAAGRNATPGRQGVRG